MAGVAHMAGVRVTLGGYPPRVPTGPYVHTLAHTVPQVEDSLRNTVLRTIRARANGYRWRSRPMIAHVRLRSRLRRLSHCCQIRCTSSRYEFRLGKFPVIRSRHSVPEVSGLASVVAHRQNHVDADDTRTKSPGRLVETGPRPSCASPPSSPDESDTSNG